MKSCPQCHQSYEDENLNFCLNDGTALTAAGQAPTILMPSSPPTEFQSAAPTQWQQPVQQSQPSGKKSKSWIWVLLLFGLLLLLCGGGVGGLLLLRLNQSNANTDSSTPSLFESPDSEPPTSSSTSQQKKKESGNVTMANYERLRNGMSRSEVESILGGKGTELSSSSGAGMSFAVIQWEKEDFKSIIVTFQNDKIMSKTQVGLGND